MNDLTPCNQCNDTGLLHVWADRRDERGRLLSLPSDDPDQPDDWAYEEQCGCPAGVALDTEDQP